jgi:hypothetical protein
MLPAASPPQRWRATATVPIPVRRPKNTGVADRSRWHWLLAVPAIVPLLTPLYNRTEPRLAGIPFFCWCQLAFVGLAVGVVTLVYQATARRRDRS